MSSKNFLLRLCSSTSRTERYTLVLNEHLTTDDFISDIHELFPPPPPPATSTFQLLLNNKYPMTPKQFLRYMTKSVPYSPNVAGGVCVPVLFGEDNIVKVTYESELEEEETILPPQDEPNADPVAPAPRPSPLAINTSNRLQLARVAVDRGSTRTDNGPPTHDNRPHSAFIHPQFKLEDSTPVIEFRSRYISLDTISRVGGPEETQALVQLVLAGLPGWTSSLNLSVKFSMSGWGINSLDADRFRWDEGSFKLDVVGSEVWHLTIFASVTGTQR